MSDGDESTSVNAALRDFLTDYADGIDRQRNFRRRLVELAEQSHASSEGQSWAREDLDE